MIFIKNKFHKAAGIFFFLVGLTLLFMILRDPWLETH